jgi:hypothetical protein
MLTEFGSAIMIAGALAAGGHEDVPVQDRNICTIERPIAVAPIGSGEYEIWIFESSVQVCPKRRTKYAGPTTDDETIKQIIIGGTGGK